MGLTWKMKHINEMETMQMIKYGDDVIKLSELRFCRQQRWDRDKYNVYIVRVTKVDA